MITYMLLKFLRACAVALPVYLILRYLWLRHKRKVPNPAPVRASREATLAIFVVYWVGVLLLAFEPGGFLDASLPVFSAVAERLQSGAGMNFTPFLTIRSFFAGGYNGAFAINVGANVLLFIPLGFFPPFLWQRFQSWRYMLPFVLLFPVLIEFTQLFLGRSVDIDDWILNAIGLLAGVLLCRLLHHVSPASKRFSIETAHEKTDP